MNKIKWQSILKMGYRDSHQLLKDLSLDAHVPSIQSFPLWVPKPFVERMMPGNINDPLLQQILPTQAELQDSSFLEDPLQELQQSPDQGLIHKYHNRLLLMVSGGCALHCRYCFRRHFPYAQHTLDLKTVDRHLTQHPNIDEVILSGGDPLMLHDNKLAALLKHISHYKQIKFIRIHTRLPIVIPDRITPEFIQALECLPTVTSIVFHINHPNEIDHSVHQALKQLPSSILLYNQSVLLKGINDCPNTLKKLSHTLISSRIQPYYLHLLDPVKGAHHFQTDLKNAKKIYQELQATTPGYLVPKLCQEVAHQPHKILIGNR